MNAPDPQLDALFAAARAPHPRDAGAAERFRHRQRGRALRPLLAGAAALLLGGLAALPPAPLPAAAPEVAYDAYEQVWGERW